MLLLDAARHIAAASRATPADRPRIDRLIDDVAAAFRVTRADLLGPGRPRRLCHARWAAMMIARSWDWSLPRVGEALGRDHTTVIHGIRQAIALIAVDNQFAGRLAYLAGRYPA